MNDKSIFEWNKNKCMNSIAGLIATGIWLLIISFIAHATEISTEYLILCFLLYLRIRPHIGIGK